MKVKVLDKQKTELGEVDLPSQFNEEIRPDLIKRAVHTIQANTRQPYGAKEDAGMRHSVEISRRRHNFKGSYGFGISRVPRKIMSARGTRFNWTAAEAPGTVGGRRAHAPKPEKDWTKKMNKKERRKAIRSAISASILKPIVEKRGHKTPANYPFMIDSKFELMTKTDDVVKALITLGLKDELERSSERTIRAGKGKMRGRKYKSKVGPLIVVSDKCELQKSARNIKGVDVRVVSRLNAEVLAPGADYGRLTLWSKAAVEKMKEKNLFV